MRSVTAWAWTARGRAHFVIADAPLSFGQLARYFRDELKVANALYLDGPAAALWDPASGQQGGRMDGGRTGPIIVVTKTPGSGAMTSSGAILVIDNYDSFTFNLVHYLMELGAEVRVERNDALTAAEALQTNAAGFPSSRPAPARRTRRASSLDLVAACADARKPLMGVCLGHQAIGQHFGGRVQRGGLMQWQDVSGHA